MYKDDVDVSNRREILEHVRKVEVSIGFLKHRVSEKVIDMTALYRIDGYLHLAIGNIDLACGVLEEERLLRLAIHRGGRRWQES